MKPRNLIAFAVLGGSIWALCIALVSHDWLAVVLSVGVGVLSILILEPNR